MDIAANQYRIFGLRRAIANLQREYAVAVEKDLQFSVKKRIRVRIKELQQELSLLQPGAPANDSLYKSNLN